MSYISDKIKNIQDVWKQLTLFGIWFGTIAGSFLLPLPEWDSVDQQDSKTRLILFISTVVAGFMLILTYNYKRKNLWLWISGVTFFFFLTSFYTYDNKRETNTLPYYQSTKVVGNIVRKDFKIKIKACGLEEGDKDLLKCVWGDATKLWTRESIDYNRNELIIFIILSYVLLTVFMISFINTIILYTSKNEEI
nr:hypothetical protein [uncultured Flavobacterium sp.]